MEDTMIYQIQNSIFVLNYIMVGHVIGQISHGYFLFLTFYLGSLTSSVQLGAKLFFHVTSNCLSHVSICLKFKARASAKKKKKKVLGKTKLDTKDRTQCYFPEHIYKIFYENLKRAQYQWDIIFFGGGDFFGSNNNTYRNDS